VSTASISIRQARPDDLKKLAAVERSAASVFRGVGLAWLADGGTMDAAVLAQLCQDGTLWVAADERDEPVGFLAAYELDGSFHIAEVSVAQSHQRLGIGARLVGVAREHGTRVGFGAVTLTTYRDLAWNGPFYARLGFAEIDPGEAGPGHVEKLREEAEAGHDPVRRCLMALRLDQPARSSRIAESRSNM
jgi:GNAT superfamily N-acetyltransferase